MSSWRSDPGGTLTVDAEPIAERSPGLRVLSEPQASAPRDGRFTRGRVRTLMAADMVAVQLALFGMYLLAELIGPPAFIAPTWLLAALWVGVTLGWPVLFATYKLYEGETRAIAPASFDEVGKLFHALLAGSLVLLVVGQGFKKGFDYSVYTPLEAAMFLSIALVLIPTFRGVLRTWVLPAVMRPRRTIIVGAGPVGQLVRRKINAHPEYGLDLVGFVDDRENERRLGTISELTRLVDEREIDWVVIADSDAPYEETLALLRAVRRPTSTCRSSRPTSSCSRPTRRSRTSRGCRSSASRRCASRARSVRSSAASTWSPPASACSCCRRCSRRPPSRSSSTARARSSSASAGTAVAARSSTSSSSARWCRTPKHSASRSPSRTTWRAAGRCSSCTRTRA